MIKNKTVCAILPSYNEAKTIERVLNDLKKISFLSQIIIVDDGSIDSTQEILKTIKASSTFNILTNTTNKGKGFSVALGLEKTDCDLILLLDADIINYTESDLLLLVNPVVDGLFDYTVKITDDVILKKLSGIRCYWRKDLMPLIPKMKKTTKFGLEILFNKHLSHKKGSFVKLFDYHHYQKWEKYSLPKALWEYGKEFFSIISQFKNL